MDFFCSSQQTEKKSFERARDARVVVVVVVVVFDDDDDWTTTTTRSATSIENHTHASVVVQPWNNLLR